MKKHFNQILSHATKTLPNYANHNIVFCSGGVDSVAITHILSKDKNLNIGIYHFNHKLRSQNDAMYYKVRELADFLGIAIYSNEREYNQTDLSEDGLRKSRLQSADLIFRNALFITGHHLDDCVESYMLNCIRGHQEYLPIPFCTKLKNNTIVHPFLFTKKAALRTYCEKHGLMKFVEEDETNNVSRGSRRNMIRNEILPIFKRDCVGLDTVVSKIMEKRLLVDLLK